MEKLNKFGEENVFGYAKQRQTGGGPPPKEPLMIQEKIMKLFEGTPLFTGLDGFETGMN